ncbi:PREDICTED: mediator of RNA polymerase II transcription subunit 11-like [Priapulus caudatus]|uniref:Mediator of RNA polymerase II transcription subunit 11 n=1 Tax=Priapulus caudatus TaxID=37621 RepID=A0ABM1EZD6_PRICU|nr:PREDICTED: mediator of RNA polymerase II transcription subunit 11-like [Priapulus caudatus]
MGGPMERLQQLESIEKDIGNVLQCAGTALQELSKDKPSMKQVESHTSSFLKTLEIVESGLSKQIQYLTQVSTGQSHEGSSYAAQKELQMALHRLEHAKSRVLDLERVSARHVPLQPPAPQQPSTPASAEM